MSHFEDVWENCEKFHKDNFSDETVQSIVSEIVLKLNLYNNLDLKPDLNLEDKQKIKDRTLGEILLAMTKLSLKDNVNVFSSLNSALQYRSIEHFSSKY
jgi:hypothetical protein